MHKTQVGPLHEAWDDDSRSSTSLVVPDPLGILAPHNTSPQLSPISTMTDDPQRQEGVLSLLNVAIRALEFAREVSDITLAAAVFGSASILLTMIRVSFSPFHEGISQAHTRPGHYDQ